MVECMLKVWRRKYRGTANHNLDWQYSRTKPSAVSSYFFFTEHGISGPDSYDTKPAQKMLLYETVCLCSPVPSDHSLRWLPGSLAVVFVKGDIIPPGVSVISHYKLITHTHTHILGHFLEDTFYTHDILRQVSSRGSQSEVVWFQVMPSNINLAFGICSKATELRWSLISPLAAWSHRMKH